MMSFMMFWAWSVIAAQPTTPGDSQLSEHIRLARQYLAEGKPTLAIPELKSVLELDPTNVDAHANLGVLLYFAGQYSAAIPNLNAAVHARPGLTKIQVLLGISEQRTGDLHAAQSDLSAAFPLLSELKILKEAGLALVETDQALGALDKAAVTISSLRARLASDPQVLGAAYEVYSQARSETLISLAVSAPDSAELYFVMGEQLGMQGETGLALMQFRRALALNPDLPGLHYELAQTLSVADDPALRAEAAAEYGAAIKLNSFDEKAWSGLADVEAEGGKTAQAASDYKKALNLSPDDSGAQIGLAKILVTEKRDPEAISLLELAVKSDPTNSVAHYRLSTLYRAEGRLEDAKQQLELYEHFKVVQSQLQTIIHTMRAGNLVDPRKQAKP